MKYKILVSKTLMASGLLLFSLMLVAGCSGAHPERAKQTMAAIEPLEVVDAKIRFLARVDTGAMTSSVHAVDIQLGPHGGVAGAPIGFRLVNKNGLSGRINTLIDSVVTVRTAHGTALRYKVPLSLRWRNTTKRILVTLSDRSAMTYRLLLGRNWLTSDFVVDVDQQIQLDQ